MLDYILRGGVTQHADFFSPEKFESIKEDIKTFKWEETHQPLKMKYGNRFQGMPCYQYEYKKENDYIINRLESIIQYNITDFNLIARKILISEIKASTQDFSKYGFVHRDYPADTPQEPLIAGMMYFDQSYDGGTAFFHNQMEKAPDSYVSAFPNRLVLYHGGRYHANCFDYTMEERITFSFFFKLKQMEQPKQDIQLNNERIPII
tara:strand:- start:882 stop:1499 length:618 start_codon:yes stop_codon:yes gene_type:complete